MSLESRRSRIPLRLSLLLLIASCGGSDTPPADPIPEAAPSSNPRIKFKGDQRLRNDISRALALEPDELCNELGKYSCIDDVHAVVLGGVKPYSQAIYAPLSRPALTSPVTAERVAMSACIERVDRDLIGDETVIFGSMDVDADGRLRDVDAPELALIIDTLYQRVLQRNPWPHEVEHLRGLYRDIEASGAESPARDWAVLACSMTMTTVEQLFY